MYLGRVVEQGSAVDVIERPQPPLHAGARRRRSRCRRRRRRASASCSAASSRTPTDDPVRLPLPPALPAALRALRPRRPGADRRRRARTSSPPACCTTRRCGRCRARRRRWLSAGARSPGRSAGSSPGPRNAITDVPGVRVGHSQAASGERTGVTRRRAARAARRPPGRLSVNGTGELTGKLEIDERGRIETPIYLCGTHAVGTVFQAAVLASGRGPEDVVIPVVGECDDGDMADSRTVTAADVERALAALGAEVAEGSVGAGTGMSCFDFPGGIGTASRRVGEHTPRRAAALQLRRSRVPRPARHPARARGGPAAARRAPASPSARPTRRSAPTQLRRLALRPAARPRARRLLRGRRARARSASPSERGRGAAAQLDELDPLFAAAYEAAHEAVLNCLVAARPATPPRRLDAGGLPDRARSRALAARAGAMDARSSRSPTPASRARSSSSTRALIRIDTSNPPGSETAAAELLAALPRRGRRRVRAHRPRPGAAQPGRPDPGRARGPR